MPGEGSGGSCRDGDSIKVFLRVRPPEVGSTNELCVDVDTSANCVIMRAKPDSMKKFTFDHVAEFNIAQENVFNTVGKPVIDSCLSGYNGTIFAYGQTGSGKTFTMLGPAEESDNFKHELRGVIPRTFEYLFHRIRREQELKGDKISFLCRCSFLEIYNEQIFDLLDPSSPNLHLREDMKKGVFVNRLIEQVVSSASEAYQVLTSGWSNRTVASTAMNRESSRSHAVFTMHLESKLIKEDVETVKVSQLHLVDLAGSERQKDTKVDGVRLKEASCINNSLSVLGNVITALVDIGRGKKRFVPYRNSKLSFLLRDSIGGNAKTCLIACIHPEPKCYGESLSTLHFANRAKMVKNKAKVNEGMHGNVAVLQAEIQRLKEALQQYQDNTIVKEVPSNEEPVSYSNTEAYKKFYQAMLYVQKTQEEFQNLQKQISQQEQLCQSKDKALQQKTLIIKFKEEALKRVEKKIKDGCKLDNTDIVTSLKAEVQCLKQFNEHHPDIAKYRTENDKLRSEVNRMKGCNKYLDDLEMDAQRRRELDHYFREIVAPQVTGPAGTSTPQTTSTESVATAECHKSRVTKLEAELENLRQQKEDEAIQRDAEITSLKKTIEEYQRMYQSHRRTSIIQTKNMNERHMETLKIITTPKKTKYELRNRTVLVPGSGHQEDEACGEGIPKFDLSGDEGMISEECEPSDMNDKAALRVEIEQLQEEVCELRSQLDTKGSEILETVQRASKLEEESRQLTKYLEETRATAVDEAKTSSSLRDKLDETIKDKTLLEHEVQDLRIVSTSFEDQFRNLQKRHESEMNEFRQKIHELEDQLGNKTIEIENQQEELTKLSYENDLLKEERSSWEDERGMLEHQLSGVEAQLAAEKTERGRVVADLVSMTADRDSARKDKDQLMVQLTEQETDKQEKLADMIGDRDRLRSELESANRRVIELDAEIVENQKKIKEFLRQQEQHTKEMALTREMVATLNTQKDRLLLANEEQWQEAAEAEDRHQGEVFALQEQLREKQEQIDAAQTQIEEQAARINQCDEQLNVLVCEKTELETENESLYDGSMTAQAAQMEAENLRQEAETQLKTVEEERSELQKELSGVKEKLSDSTQELEVTCAANSQLKAEQATLQQQLKDAHSKEKDERIIQLTCENEALIKDLAQINENHKTEIQELRQQKDRQVDMISQESNNMMEQWVVVQTDNTKLQEEIRSVKKEKEGTDSRLIQLESEVDHWKDELKRSLSGKQDLENKLSSAEISIQELRQRILEVSGVGEHWKKELERAMEAKAMVEGKLAKADQNNQELRRRISTLDAEVTNRKEDLGRTHVVREEMEAKVSGIRQKNQELEARIAEFEAILIHRKEVMEAAMTEKEDLQSQLCQLQQCNEELIQRMAEIADKEDEEKKEMTTFKENLERELKIQELNNQELSESLSALQQELEEVQRRHLETAAEKQELSEQAEKQRGEHEAFKETITFWKNKAEENEAYAAGLAGHHNPNQRIQYIQNLREQLQDTREKLSTSTEEIVKLRDRNEKLETALMRKRDVTGTPLKENVPNRL